MTTAAADMAINKRVEVPSTDIFECVSISLRKNFAVCLPEIYLESVSILLLSQKRSMKPYTMFWPGCMDG